MCVGGQEAVGLLGEPQSCLSTSMNLVFVTLASVDGLIAIVAAVQLLRHYLHNKYIGWTRQKVFHSLIGASNLGYVLYFSLTPLAACRGWACFSNACGFLLIATPQILFLATFLLLLSFWVDLCHQANDNEEDEDDDVDVIDPEYTQLPSSPVQRAPRANDSKWACCVPFLRRWRVRGRQRFVILVVMGICLLTVAFAVLIWYGMYDNPIDSVKMAQVYANFFALVILISGGGLASYGLLLYTKMSKVRSGKDSADIKKVAGLALVSVVCFSLKAILILLSDIPDLNIWHMKHADSQLCPPLTFLYYLIGESVPSIVVLWVMRDLPPRFRDSTMNGRQSSDDLVIEEALVPDTAFLPQWVTSAAGRPYLLLPGCCNSDISPS